MNRATRITAIAISALAGAAVVAPVSATAATGATPANAGPLLTGQLLFSYIADGSGNPGQIAVANPDGTGLRTITPTGPGVQTGDEIGGAQISPDGQHMLLVANNLNSGSRLLVADSDGSNATAVPLPATESDAVSVNGAVWSGDGSWIYADETNNGVDSLVAVHPDGSGLHDVVAGFHSGVSVATETGEIGWPEQHNPGNYDIYNPATGQTRTVVLPKYADGGSLSPDGKFVASLVLPDVLGSPNQVAVTPTDGSAGWVLKGADPAYNVSQSEPTWSPDESRLAYVSEVNVPGSSEFLPEVTVASSSGNTPGQTHVPSFAPPASSVGATWAPLPAGTPLKPPTANLPAPQVKVYRDAGGDRVQTGIAISQQKWANSAAKAVVLATSLNYPDALTGGPLAAKKDGPLLLTDGSANQVDPRVLAEIKRVLPAGGAVYVLGGDAAVKPAIVAQLKALGYQITQFKGVDRADTALQVARTGMGSPQHVVLATGAGFADALAAGPYAAGPFADAPGAPAAIVLSNGAALDPATAAFLHGKTVATVGAQAGKAWPDAAKSFPGIDRFDTAARVAREFTGAFANTQVGIANGIASATNPGYPDALTGGAFMAESNGPIVLVNGIGGVIPPETQAVLAARTGNVRADIFGGTAIISPALAASIVSLLHGIAQF